MTTKTWTWAFGECTERKLGIGELSNWSIKKMYLATTNMTTDNMTKKGNDLKPPANDHKPSADDQKLPADEHKPPAYNY